MGKTIGGVDYTNAQCMTIALAELASALGARLPREAAGWEDWAAVEFLTAHVREAGRGFAPLLVHGLPVNAKGDLVHSDRPWVTRPTEAQIADLAEAQRTPMAPLPVSEIFPGPLTVAQRLQAIEHMLAPRGGHSVIARLEALEKARP